MRAIAELRQGLRSLTRAPGFFGLAVLTLALGIGAAALMFSVTESVLWRPLALPDAGRLVSVSEFEPRTHPNDTSSSAANFLEWRQRARSFEGLAAAYWDSETHTLTGSGERVRSLAISAGFFETLGVRPALGRFFTRSEEGGSRAVAILSNDFWRAHWGGAADAVGRTIQLDRRSYTVAGVLPADFRLAETVGIADPDLFVPADFSGAGAHRAERSIATVGRLKRGVSLDAAGAEMAALARRMAATEPDDAGWGVRVEDLRWSFARYNRTVLYLFFGFAIFVLAIACANVAGLELVRAAGRRREYALRAALGAGRGALLRQALAEAAWIALPGGAAGIVLADWGVEGVRALLPPGMLVRAGEISLDWRALAFVLSVSGAITALVAMAPALLARGKRLESALREGARSVTASRGTGRALNGLIAAEIALSFVLLFSVALFLGSNARLREVALGFDPRNVVSLRVTAGAALPSESARQAAFYRELERRAGEVAGVRQAELASDGPLSGGAWIPYAIAGRPQPARGEERDSLVRVVTPGFFGLLHIPLLAGRAFSAADAENAPRVAIVNENLAHSAFPGENPVGKVLTILPGNPAIPPGVVEIVGLAANTRELGISEVAFEDIYLPFAQNPQRTVTLLAKTAGASGGIVAALRDNLRQLDPDSAVYSAGTMEETVAQQFRGERFRMLLVSLFAALAALLAAVGVYGAIAFSVAQRSREFALRMALGALPGAIRKNTLARTARLTLAGAACGLAIALALGELLRSQLYLVPHQHGGVLYGVSIHDPAGLCAAAAAVVLLALCASLIPAARAAHVEPAAELRQE